MVCVLDINGILRNNPVIAAAQHENLQLAVDSKVSSVILMNARLNDLLEDDFKSCNKKKPIFLHTDLIKGLSTDKDAINFIKKYIDPAGIVSTKSNILRAAKKKELITIQRIFLIDSSSLKNAIEIIKENDPDMVEIMPSWVYPMVHILKAEINKPLILGGLVNTKEQIENILKANADGVSCSNIALWDSIFDKI